MGPRSLEIRGDALQARDFTDVDDVVLASCLAAERAEGAGEVFTVASGRRHSLIDLVDRRGRLLPHGGRRIRRPPAPRRPGAGPPTLADIARARHALGGEVAVPFEEGVRRTVAAPAAAPGAPAAGS